MRVCVHLESGYAVEGWLIAYSPTLPYLGGQVNPFATVYYVWDGIAYTCLGAAVVKQGRAEWRYDRGVRDVELA